jgi:hypothetical protein
MPEFRYSYKGKTRKRPVEAETLHDARLQVRNKHSCRMCDVHVWPVGASPAKYADRWDFTR